jgi:hypothetical protein
VVLRGVVVVVVVVGVVTHFVTRECGQCGRKCVYESMSAISV